jgi:hypothetical protein
MFKKIMTLQYKLIINNMLIIRNEAKNNTAKRIFFSRKIQKYEYLMNELYVVKCKKL